MNTGSSHKRLLLIGCLLFACARPAPAAADIGTPAHCWSIERKDAQTSEFRFLWRLIRSGKTATSSTFEFNPLFYSETDTAKGSYWAILGGLIGRETSTDGRSRMRWLWVL